jgi:hypothetical protein
MTSHREAWHKLGDMSKEKAMVKYVEELKQVGRDCVSEHYSKTGLVSMLRIEQPIKIRDKK